MLEDLATGTCSVLERGYLELERRHGLPGPAEGTARQVTATSACKTAYRDVVYRGYGVIVELDGRAFHDHARARDRDAGRDLDHLVVDDAVTIRLTYGLVFRNGCRAIAKVGAVLQRRGWPGAPVSCPACPGSRSGVT